MEHPVKPTDIADYALAIHRVLNGERDSLQFALGELFIDPFKAKLIDGFLINHAAEIWKWMQRELDEVTG